MVASRWADTLLRQDPEPRELSHLYKGPYWSAALGLTELHPEAELFVVSAGLGLVSAGALHSAYSATFSSGHPDSVPGASTSEGRRSWWGLLNGSARLRRAVERSGRTLVVLPNRYLGVVADDLAAADRGQVIVFASSCPPALAELLGERLFRVRAPMVRELGSNVGALAPKAAAFAFPEPTTDLATARARFGQLDSVQDRALYPVRQKQSPEQVVEWLGVVLDGEEPPTSASAALRAFRASGRAFEQKRFHRLFHEVMEKRG